MSIQNPIISDVTYGSRGAYVLNNLEYLGEFGCNVMDQSGMLFPALFWGPYAKVEKTVGASFDELEKLMYVLDIGVWQTMVAVL